VTFGNTHCSVSKQLKFRTGVSWWVDRLTVRHTGPVSAHKKTETVSGGALDSTNSLTPWSCGWCLTEGQRIGDQCRSTGFFYHRGEQLSCKCNKKAARTQNFGSITLKHGQASRTWRQARWKWNETDICAVFHLSNLKRNQFRIFQVCVTPVCQT